MKTEVPEILFAPEKAKEVALFFFNKMKTSEVSAIVLAQLMYKAEREFYQEYGCGITMDQLIHGKNGPLLKHTSSWLLDDNFHALKEELAHSPKKSEDQLLTLSDAEVEVLSKNWQDFTRQELKAWQQGFICLPESNLSVSSPIYLQDLFYSVGFNMLQIKPLVESILAMEHIEKVFKGIAVKP